MKELDLSQSVEIKNIFAGYTNLRFNIKDAIKMQNTYSIEEKLKYLENIEHINILEVLNG